MPVKIYFIDNLEATIIKNSNNGWIRPMDLGTPGITIIPIITKYINPYTNIDKEIVDKIDNPA